MLLKCVLYQTIIWSYLTLLHVWIIGLDIMDYCELGHPITK